MIGAVGLQGLGLWDGWDCEVVEDAGRLGIVGLAGAGAVAWLELRDGWRCEVIGLWGRWGCGCWMGRGCGITAIGAVGWLELRGHPFKATVATCQEEDT